MNKFLLFVASATLIGAVSCTSKAESAEVAETQATNIAETEQAQTQTQAEAPVQAESEAQTEATASVREDNALIIGAKGLPAIQIGMVESDIPATLSGVYNSKSSESIEPDDFMTYEIVKQITCKLNGKDALWIYLGKDKKICGIYVGTPDITTAEGIHVGSPVSDVKKISGIEHEINEMTDLESYSANGITYFVDDAGTKVRLISVGHTL